MVTKKTSRVIIVIPARMGSTRLPGKALLNLGGKSVVRRVWEQAMKIHSADIVIVATDHDDIKHHCQDFGAVVIMTSEELESGTDRVAKVAEAFDENDIIINLQGDLPFVDARVCSQLVNILRADKEADMATPCLRMPAHSDSGAFVGYGDPSAVKVVFDHQKYALYFSRNVIPSGLQTQAISHWFHHFGIYAYFNCALQLFTSLPPSHLEKGEGLEQLRALENGFKIRMVETIYEAGQEINTPEDYENACAMLSALNS